MCASRGEPTTESVLAERHQRHWQEGCNCLADSCICCDPGCAECQRFRYEQAGDGEQSDGDDRG